MYMHTASLAGVRAPRAEGPCDRPPGRLAMVLRSAIGCFWHCGQPAACGRAVRPYRRGPPDSHRWRQEVIGPASSTGGHYICIDCPVRVVVLMGYGLAPAALAGLAIGFGLVVAIVRGGFR